MTVGVLRPHGRLIVAAALGTAVLLGLGIWQMQRLAWKEGLIRAVAERASAAPVAAPSEAEWSRLDPAAIEYRRVVLQGAFRHEDEVRVFTDLAEPKGRTGGIGYWVLTPLVRDDGTVVIIDRGFVPADKAEPATRPEGQVPGRVEIVGLMRSSEARNLFTPADDPARNAWYTRDPEAIGRAKGLSRVAPFYVDAEASGPGGLPQGGETRLAFPNRHLEYALTWFGLAATLVVMAAIVLFRQSRTGRP